MPQRCKHSQCQSPGTKAALPCRSCRKRLPKLWPQIPRPIGTKFSPHRECHIARSDQKRLFPGLPFSSLPPVEASCSLSVSPDHEDFRSCQMGTLLTVGQIGKPCSALLKTGAAIVHCHVCRFPAPSGPLAGAPPPCSPSRHCDSRALHARQSRRFLESPSLPPPLAALRAIPRNPLACSASGSAFPQKHRPASRFPAPKRGRKPGPFLETSSLFPPLAALRLFPHNTVENFVHNVENFPLCHPVEKL